jgi:hypothetical protein
MRLAGKIVGTLLILAGVVWFFQGIGVLPGSFMTGESFWAYTGGVCVVVGGGLLALSFRR